MPWKAVTKMQQKEEFLRLAIQKAINFSDLCKRFTISRKTGYKWLGRFEADEKEGSKERSRRPRVSPTKTVDEVEKLILEVRDNHKVWGGEKIKKYLENKTKKIDLPSVKTVGRILKRNGYITEEESNKHKAFIRFEHPNPNDLWQADYKGHFLLLNNKRCHPLTILDDNSRYSLKLKACYDQTIETTEKGFIECFERYGLPKRMNFDNAPPWGNSQSRYTQLTLWLIRQDIKVGFSRPYHPQTNGKDERFHRTLKMELLQFNKFKDLEETQRHFDEWREMYNHERPHGALDLNTPSTKYKPSAKEYTGKILPIEYDSSFEVRQVKGNGCVSFKGKQYYVGKFLNGEKIGIRPKDNEGKYEIYYCNQRMNELDLVNDSNEN